MAIVAWVAVGLIAGFVASRVVNRRGEHLMRDLMLGVVGAFVGSAIFDKFGEPGVAGVNPYSVGVAAFGAIITLISYHTMISGQPPKR